MNDLTQLLRENVAGAPADHVDVAAIVASGRLRVRTRRTTVAAGLAVLVAGVVVVVSGAAGGGHRAEPAKTPPTPDAPTLRLADAGRAVAGRDYRVLASYTNENLDNDNGQYFDGVTDDGLILFRDGPRADQLRPRFALLDPATGAKDWLPDLRGVGQDQTWPVELSKERLVVLVYGNPPVGRLTAHVFDRGERQWHTLTWPDLPKVDGLRAVTGPDGRLYVPVPASQGKVPDGGWPTGPDGEAEDADAAGDTYELWSVSLTDPTDVRDEGMTVGDLAFTDGSMVWTDSTNGHAGLVHVRDLATGEEHSFDPHAGTRCNLLSFGASGDRVMMSEYCGTYAQGVRDDRVQILTTDGDQVATLQDTGVDGSLPEGSDLVNISAYRDDDRSGTYVYDLATGRFLRVSHGLSQWGLGGRTGEPREFMWHTPVNHRHGATQRIGELLR